MNSQLPYWAIICLMAVLLSSCITFSPQEAQISQPKIQNQKEEIVATQKSDKLDMAYTVSCQSALVSNTIRAIAADESRVWVATDKGVSMLSRSSNIWSQFTKDDGLASDNVNAVAVDNQWVWFGTNDGISRYDTKNGSWKTFKSKDGLKGKTVFCITVDRDYVWFGTDGGLNRYDKNIDSWAARTKKDGLSDNFVTAIAITGDYMWVGNRWNGVNRYDKTTDSWNTYSKKAGLIDTEITTIAAVDNFIWFGTYKSGVSLYDKTNQTFVKTYTKTDVLSSNDIRAITADGNHIWIGTANGGVHRYIQTVDTWVRYTKNDGLAGDNINCITVYNNEIWFGSYDSGLTLYNKVSNQWVQYVKADTIPSNDINDVARDSEGTLWIATVNGLAKYTPGTNKWSRYGKESGLTTDFTTTVSVNNDQVWLGTARGLATLNTKSGQWKYYTNANGLSHDFITSLEITDHKAWIGTNKGLFCMGTENEEFCRVDDLTNKAITTIAHNSDHLWIGTPEGLWNYNPDTKKSKLYTESEGLTDSYINSVLVWGQDNVWIGTRGGIFAYDKSALTFSKVEDNCNADDHSKISSTDNVVAMSYDDKRQRIWIGKPDGLSSFDIQNGVWTYMNGFKAKFSQHNIKSISVDEEHIWLGTASGLSEYHPSDNNWSEHRAFMSREFLREDMVSNIEFDGDYVWFSNWNRSHNGAIIRYNRRTDAWQVFGREVVLKDTKAKSMTTVRRIVVDNGAVWFTTDYGILRYNKADDTWNHFTTQDGLIDNSIGNIVCGNNVVWVSYWNSVELTGAEISRYDKDSKKWEKIKIEYLIYPREYVSSMAADGDELWIGVGSSGVRKIARDGKQTLYTKADGLAQNSADWITVDGDDIWFAHRVGWDGEAISRYNKTSNKWSAYSMKDVLSDNNVERITATERYIWILYRNNNESGFTVYDKKMDEWRTIKPKSGHGWSSSIEDVAEDKDYLWVGTNNNGVKRFHIASGTWTTFDYTTGLLMNGVTNYGLKVDERYVWVGTPIGLSRYDKVTESWTNFTKQVNLSADEVLAVTVDDKYVWCGTSEGLSRYDKIYGLWNIYKHGGQGGFYYNDNMDPEERMQVREIFRNSPTDNSINTIAVDSRYLWIGTQEGANRYDKVTDMWDRFAKENGLPSVDISSIVVDGYDVWMGTSAGLCKFPRMSDNLNAWVSFTSGIDIRQTAMTKEYAETLVSNEVWCLDADQDFIWIGTMRGVSRYDKKRDIWTNFTIEDGLPTNEIGSVKVDGKLVWFGSDKGVVVYDKETHDWMTFSTKDGLSSDKITCITRDDKFIWFGTSDAGIMRYDKESKTWKSFSKNDGLAHNSVFSIAVDGDILWIGTHRGLCRYDKVKNTWTTYTRYNDSEDI
jgi:ligand-binding sensor domain-containing protein